MSFARARAEEALLRTAVIFHERQAREGARLASRLDLDEDLLVEARALQSFEPRAELALALARRRAEAPATGPRHSFAAAFTLASVDGEAAVAEAVRAAPLCHPDDRAAFAMALGLAAPVSPGERATEGSLSKALLALLPGSDSPVLRLACEALRLRGAAPFAESVVLLNHPAGSVVAEAARTLTAACRARPEVEAGRAILGRALADATGSRALALAEAQLSLGDPGGLAFARASLTREIAAPHLTDESRLGCLRLLALGGEAGDVELFFRSLEPLGADATAVGWFGHADLVEWLVASFEAASDARRASGGPPHAFEVAASAALDRITGAARQGQLEGPEGPHGLAEASSWRSFWRMARTRFERGVRYRFGEPFTPAMTLDELEGAAAPADRREAATELAAASGGAARVELGSLAARQRDDLAAARAWLASAGYAPGAFTGASRRGLPSP